MQKRRIRGPDSTQLPLALQEPQTALKSVENDKNIFMEKGFKFGCFIEENKTQKVASKVLVKHENQLEFSFNGRNLYRPFAVSTGALSLDYLYGLLNS